MHCSDTDDDFGFITLEQAMREMIDSMKRLHALEAEELKRGGASREAASPARHPDAGEDRTASGIGIHRARHQGPLRIDRHEPKAGDAVTPFPALPGGILEERTGRADASGKVAAADELGEAAAGAHADTGTGRMPGTLRSASQRSAVQSSKPRARSLSANET